MIWISAAIALYLAVDLLLPLMRQQQRASARDFQERLRFFKLRTVREFYPELADLSLREIEELYDVDEAYDRIGRSRR